MAPRKEVASLLDLAFGSVGDYLTIVCHDLLKNKLPSASELNKLYENLRDLLYGSTVRLLHERMGNLCLEVLVFRFYCSAVKEDNLSNKCYRAKKIASHLGGLIANTKIKRINRSLPEPIATALLDVLDEMTGLEELAFWPFYEILGNRSETGISLLEERFINCCRSFQHLTHFLGGTPCSDAVIAAICENCPELRIVAVHSPVITDDCIENLIHCRKLEVANLSGSRITSQGLFRLITETKSKSLKTVGLRGIAGQVLQLLNSRENCEARTFSLEHLSLVDLENEELLTVACKFFPLLRELMWDSIDVPDLSSLVNLQQLEKLHFEVENISPTHHRLSRFLSIRGAFITSLTLHSQDELSVRTIVNMCSLCPNLKELLVLSYMFSDAVPGIEFPEPLGIASCESFQKLEKFEAGYYSLNLAQTVIRYAQNVEYLNLFSSRPVTDEFFYYVFQFNPLQRLKHLELSSGVDGVTANMLKNIIKNCNQLKCIVYLRDDLTTELELIQDVESFIKTNNYDVKFSHDDSFSFRLNGYA